MPGFTSIHFEISERKILLRVFDVFFVFLFLFLIGEFWDFNYFTFRGNNCYWTIVLGVYIAIFGTVFEMYNLQVSSNRFLITRSVLLTTSVTTLLYLLTPFFTPELPGNRLQILLFYGSILLALLLWRNLYLIFLASHRFVKQVIFVGDATKIMDLANDLKTVNPHYHIKGFVATTTANSTTSVIPEITLEDLTAMVRKHPIAEIVVTHDVKAQNSKALYDVLLELLENGVVIRDYTELYEAETYRLPLYDKDEEVYRFFPFSRSNQNKLYAIYSRLLDIVLSVLGLLFFIPIVPIVFLLNLIGNKGPLLYKQLRVGKNGKTFGIVKLRTMVPNAEQNGAVYAQTNDVRITPIGKFLRRSRIDEIPQFINVLKGEMAVIGPRPERPVFVEQIAERIPLYQTRHVIKPGLTGWAQVNYPYGQSLDDSLMKLRYDLYYIKHRSLYLDLSITVKTISTILFFRGQ
ncbi:exopolysaccharide biosynthesis polyprenyl glycosylphosphotransferase [Flavobacterium chuncheonense]|uniref:Exopolysaccharide biosynthesis polyprenyl glycosylphosphotransferase n=1 Tax=Flavobacterium chuncheonense TaxID=2026653 RepID=A0ABW5YJ02_9FLAO